MSGEVEKQLIAAKSMVSISMLDSTPLQPDLQPGETLEWTGRPNPWRVFTLGDVFLIPFSLMWGGFAIFWEVGVVASRAPFFFRLWGIPFVLIGLYLIFGRFLYSAWDRRHTWYGVTNQRVIILTTTFGHRVQSIYFNMLPEIETIISASGRGTLLFSPSPLYRMYSWTAGNARRSRVPGFYDIPDARYVFDLISRHRRAGQ